MIDDVHTHPMFGLETPEWFKSLGAFRLRHGRDVIDMLTLVFQDQHRFTADEPRIVSANGMAGWGADQAMSPDEPLEAADIAMYADKAASRPAADS